MSNAKHADQQAVKHAGRGSNPRPADLESAALPAELPTFMREQRLRSLLALDFVKGVLAKSWRKLFKAFFHSFGNSALHADFGAVIQVTGFGALKPNIFAIERFFSHDKLQA